MVQTPKIDLDTAVPTTSGIPGFEEGIGQAQGLPLPLCAVGGRLRGTTRVSDRRHRRNAGVEAPTWHGLQGALRGESPPHEGGPQARPPSPPPTPLRARLSDQMTFLYAITCQFIV